MTRCTRSDVSELLGSYVLGACSEDEATLIRRHLSACPECSETVEMLAPARDGLLLDVEQAPVPGALRSRVMAQVRADASLFEAARERPAPRRSLLRRIAPPRRASILAGAVVAAIALTLALDGAFLAGTDRETVYTARVDGVMAPGARASVAVHDDDTRLRVSGLPDPGEGRLYEVWMVSASGPPKPAGVSFAVDANGDAEAAMPGRLHAGQQVLVTSEVGGEAAIPTRAPILRVAI